MKIKRLEITDFMAVKSADMDLSAPVHLIIGGNNQGKSSVKDAIATVLLGGKCPTRGYHKKNQADQMARRGGKGFDITLETTDGTYQRTHKNGTKSPLDEQTAEILTNPQAVLSMSAKDRQRVFSAILRGADTKNQIEAYLAQVNGFGPEIYDKCRGDLDDAQKWAVEQRRIAKRILTELQGTKKTAPESVVELAGQMFDLNKYPPDDLAVKLAQRTHERDNLVTNNKQGVDTVALKQINEALEQEKKELSSKKKLQADYEDLQWQYAELMDKRREGDTKIGQLRAEVTAAENTLQKRKQIGGDCPVCNAKISDAKKTGLIAEMENQIKLITADIELATKRNNKLSAEISLMSAKLQEAKEAINNADQTVKKIDDEIASNEKIIKDIEGNQNDDKITEINAKIENLNTLKSHATRYHEYKALAGDMAERIKSAEATSEQMDRLDALLKPDGELRKLATGGMEQVEFDQIKDQWGMETLKLGAEGEITLFGDPIEAASASEQYRAGVLLAELLSRELGVGILMLDGLEILSKENRRILFRRLPAWISYFGTIILLLTAPVGSKTPQENWLTVWEVENGVISNAIQQTGARRTV